MSQRGVFESLDPPTSEKGLAIVPSRTPGLLALILADGSSSTVTGSPPVYHWQSSRPSPL